MAGLHVSSAPHISAKPSTGMLMRDVIIALVPASAAGIYFFGVRALLVMLVSVASAVLSEYLYQRIFKKTVTVSDCSAALTGLILALNMPASVPLWIPAIGSAFAIIIIKQLFGGVGHNFLNPALAARAVLLASWVNQMSNAWTQPFAAGAAVDVMTTPTPLSALNIMKLGAQGLPAPLDMFLGNIPGCIGEVSKAAILLGLAYLLVRRVISIHIPAAFLLSAAAMFFALGGFRFDSVWVAQMLLGGMLFGAVFMATDYTTSPMTGKGQIVFGIGCGVITAIIRTFGAYPEGATYAILFMNILTPLIDKFLKPRLYGKVKRNA